MSFIIFAFQCRKAFYSLKLFLVTRIRFDDLTTKSTDSPSKSRVLISVIEFLLAAYYTPLKKAKMQNAQWESNREIHVKIQPNEKGNETNPVSMDKYLWTTESFAQHYWVNRPFQASCHAKQSSVVHLVLFESFDWNTSLRLEHLIPKAPDRTNKMLFSR